MLLHGKFVEVKIWCTLFEVLAKNKLVRYDVSTADNCFSFTERGNALTHVPTSLAQSAQTITKVRLLIYVESQRPNELNVLSYVLRVVSEMAKQEEMGRPTVVRILKNKISCGRNVLLHGKFVEVKIWCTLVEVLAKTNSFATVTRVFFSQSSTRVHQNLNLHS